MVGEELLQAEQDGVRLQLRVPAAAVHIDDALQLIEAAVPDELVGKRGGVRDAHLDDCERQPDPEHAEPVDQARAVAGRREIVRFRRDEAVRRGHESRQPVGWQRGHLLQVGELGLAQRLAREGQQAGHRHDGFAGGLERGVVAEPIDGLVRHGHGVEATCTQLVGSGQHGDRADRRLPTRTVAQGPEEFDVVGVQRPEQVDEGVGDGDASLGSDELDRSLADLGRDRSHARCVDQGELLQRRCRPGDVEPLDLVRIEVAQIELEAAGLPEGRDLDLPLGRMASAHGGSISVAVPRDDACAFTCIGRSQLFAEQRVDQRRLACLDRADQCDPQRFIGTPA
jgi:hypothetical protein